MKTCFFSDGNVETRSSKLADENATLYCIWKKLCQFLRLGAAWSKISRTSVQAGKTLSRRENIRASFQLITCRLNDDTKLLRFTPLRRLEIATKKASYRNIMCSLLVCEFVYFASYLLASSKTSSFRAQQFTVHYCWLLTMFSVIILLLTNSSFTLRL